jgi:branched-chain amino acid transport system substrate-binding protein
MSARGSAQIAGGIEMGALQRLSATLITGVLTLVACGPGGQSGGPPAASPAEPITVGVICVFSGAVNPDTGVSVRRGVEIAIDEVNASGGINGRTLKPILEDFGGQPAQAVDAAHKLIDVDKVSVIIYCTPSGPLMAFAEYAKSKNVLVIQTAASTTQMRDYRGTIFGTAPLDDLMAVELAKWMLERGHRTLVTLVPNNPYGIGVQKIAGENFRAGGGRVLGEFAYEQGKADYRPELQRLSELNPDAVIIAPFPVDAKLLFKQARDIGFVKPWFWLYPSVAGVANPEDGNDRIFGLHVGFNIPEAAKFNAEYVKRYSNPPNQPWAATTYDAVWLLARAMRLGDTTADAIRQNLPKGAADYVGATGSIGWDQDGQRVKMPIDRLVYKDGKLVSAQ